ncbi:hypothetical protein [Cupriavidus sp. H18C1]|uniref:hypothetical protein n=1 Tax=Cupriavidus sp. H18C1 TaxID=3241601 RepID=UPI003BB8EE55
MFIAAVLLQIGGSVFLISTPGFGTLYWDSYHVIRMTSETLLVDWRSLFFDALAFYLLQIWDHVYTVPLFGAALLAVTLSIPILWCREWQRAMVVALLVTVLALTPFFLTYASALFSDTFFTSFSLLSIYALMTVAERFDRRNDQSESGGEATLCIHPVRSNGHRSRPVAAQWRDSGRLPDGRGDVPRTAPYRWRRPRLLLADSHGRGDTGKKLKILPRRKPRCAADKPKFPDGGTGSQRMGRHADSAGRV